MDQVQQGKRSPPGEKTGVSELRAFPYVAVHFHLRRPLWGLLFSDDTLSGSFAESFEFQLVFRCGVLQCQMCYGVRVFQRRTQKPNVFVDETAAEHAFSSRTTTVLAMGLAAMGRCRWLI